MSTQIYFAPMEGTTGYLFRQTHHKYFPGADKYYIPFVSPTNGRKFTRRELSDVLPEHNAGLNAVPQVLTCRADDFLWAAGELAAMGYREVNLNLGCPSGTVTAKGKGSGFLARLWDLEEFLDAVYGANLGVDISIKTRLGVRDPEEFEVILELYENYPISELTIHPRVQRDFYREPVRPRWFVHAMERSKLPLCYNGDLKTVADCAALTAAWPGVDRLMIGRGLVGDPALARKLHGGSPASLVELKAFHDELYETYAAAFGDRRNASLRMKEVWTYLIRIFDGGERYGLNIKKAKSAQDFEFWSAAVFRDLPLRADNAGNW